MRESTQETERCRSGTDSRSVVGCRRSATRHSKARFDRRYHSRDSRKQAASRKEFIPFFETMDELNAPIGFHALTGMHSTPWADCFSDFFSPHVTALPFSMLVA